MKPTNIVLPLILGIVLGVIGTLLLRPATGRYFPLPLNPMFMFDTCTGKIMCINSDVNDIKAEVQKRGHIKDSWETQLR